MKSDAVPSGGDVNFRVPKQTRRKWKEPKHRLYTQEAADAIATMLTKEYEDEKAKGFDVKDRETIMKFQTGYCPTGDIILVRRLSESKLIEIDGGRADTSKDKFIVVETSPEVARPIIKGDVISLGTPNSPVISSKNMILKGIKLIEVSSYDIGGIFISKDEYYERLEFIKEFGSMRTYVDEDETTLEKASALQDQYNQLHLKVNQQIANIENGTGEKSPLINGAGADSNI